MPFTLPSLPYAYNALEPYFDAATMELHHTKHHQTYVDKLNAALESTPDLQTVSIEKLLSDSNQVPEKIRQAVINHGGGHHNHSLFWTSLTSHSSNSPTGKLAEAMNTSFTDFATFKQKFTDLAVGHFGSGWAWLIATPEKKLDLYSLPNQDSPLTKNHIPLLGLDVWEHAYYLKYQNRRAEYIDAWWHIIDWSEIESRYQQAV